MSKLLPWLSILAVLLCTIGAIDFRPVPYMPQPTGDEYILLQGVCSAPPSLLPTLLNEFPVLRLAPEFIQRSGQLVEALLPGIMSLLPDIPMGRGSPAERIIVRSGPRFL